MFTNILELPNQLMLTICSYSLLMAIVATFINFLRQAGKGVDE